MNFSKRENSVDNLKLQVIEQNFYLLTFTQISQISKWNLLEIIGS